MKLRCSSIYYINMDRSVDRREHMEKQLSNETNTIPYTRLEAIDGETHPLTPKERRMLRRANFMHNNPNTKAKNGCMGCVLSHMKLLDVIQESGLGEHECALVLEDDAILHPTFFAELEALCGDLPDDALVVHVGMTKEARWSLFVPWDLSNQTVEENIGLLMERTVTPHVGVLRTDRNPCTLAYLITRKGVQAIMDYVRHHGVNRELDWFIVQFLARQNKNYASTTVLATTSSEVFTSNIW